MNNLTFRQIRTFLAVAETGSFRRASERVHLSQPAVTAHVQQLEEMLGIHLLDRTTRRVRITPAGERFRLRAERALEELGAAVMELREEAAMERGRVLAACVPTIASRLLPEVLARFARRFPGISLRVNDIVASEILLQLAGEMVDIGIGPRPIEGSDFDFRRVARDPYVAVVPHGHPWATRKSITLKELANAPLLTLRRESNVRSTLEKSMREHSLELKPVYEVQHHYTLGGMVEAGLGVTALPSMAVSMLSQPLLRTVPIRNPEIIREVGIITLHGKNLTPATTAFVRVFEEFLEERNTAA